MAEIHELKTSATTKNQEAIDLLREWLALAEKGDVIEVALCGYGLDNLTYTGATSIRAAGPMVGSLEMLKMRILGAKLDA